MGDPICKQLGQVSPQLFFSFTPSYFGRVAVLFKSTLGDVQLSYKNFTGVTGLVLLLLFVLVGCGDDRSRGMASLKNLNKTNVMKVRTCFLIYHSRFFTTPKNKEELLELLQSGSVDKNLQRIGIDPENIEEIFTSERDGEPIKIQWNVKMVKDVLGPVAFESVGVDGVRLVAAGSLLEVDNDQEYEQLWSGELVPEYAQEPEGDG